jgi:hypothetical protein
LDQEKTMLGFKQLVTELAAEDAVLSANEVQEMIGRFGDRVRQMGHVQPDGSMSVPVEFILEAAQSLGGKLTEAAETINISGGMAEMLESAEILIERICQARERKLREMIREFQDEPNAAKSPHQWKQIEKEVFGVEYPE